MWNNSGTFTVRSDSTESHIQLQMKIRITQFIQTETKINLVRKKKILNVIILCSENCNDKLVLKESNVE